MRAVGSMCRLLMFFTGKLITSQRFSRFRCQGSFNGNWPICAGWAVNGSRSVFESGMTSGNDVQLSHFFD